MPKAKREWEWIAPRVYLDAAGQRLIWCGHPRPISALAIQVLMVLRANAGRGMSKWDILAASGGTHPTGSPDAVIRAAKTLLAVTPIAMFLQHHPNGLLRWAPCPATVDEHTPQV